MYNIYIYTYIYVCIVVVGFDMKWNKKDICHSIESI